MGRPKIQRWSDTEIDAFTHRIEQLLDQLNWMPIDLDIALGYEPEGKMTAQILGLFSNGHRRQPSRPYVQKFEQLEANPPCPNPRWSRALLPVTDLNRGAIPLQKILSTPRQCPMCVTEFDEGLREEKDTWWWFGHPRQRYCSPEHRKAWYRRQQKHSNYDDNGG